MKKDIIRDYATNAFVRYASLGCPTKEDLIAKIRSDCYKRLSLQQPQYIVMKADAEVQARAPLIEDVEAVNKVFDILKGQDREYISEAIKAIYFIQPNRIPRKGEIVERVTAYAVNVPCSTKTVYTWLKSARLLFARMRGLNTEGIGE